MITGSPRVLHIIDSLYLGGAERIAVGLTRNLGPTVGLCVTRAHQEGEPTFNAAGELLKLERRTRWDFNGARKLIDYCRANNVQILHAHGRSTLHLCAFAKTAGRLPCKLILHDHFGNVRVDRRSTLTTRAMLRSFVDRYIAVSPELMAWAVNDIGLSRHVSMVLENGIESRAFESAHPLPRRDLVAGTQPLLGVAVANLKPQKDIGLLLRAMARSSRVKARLHLAVVGRDLNDAYGRHCRQLVEELGLTENVTFLGARLDVPRILRTAEAGFLSSRSESGPLVLLEYMAAGLPFVATLTGQVAHTAAAAGLPYIVPPQDEGAYARALDALVGTAGSERARLIALGREVAMAQDLSKQAQKLRALYCDMLR